MKIKMYNKTEKKSIHERYYDITISYGHDKQIPKHVDKLISDLYLDITFKFTL